jgi:septal ring factor EnvC (AmiA/AmiB activator)
MEQSNIFSVLITAITVLGGASAWRFYEKRAEKKDKDDDFIKKDCRERISKLEALLVQSAKEKDELRKMVLDMTAQIAELRVRVEFLTAENLKLQPKPKTTTTKKNLLKG